MNLITRHGGLQRFSRGIVFLTGMGLLLVGGAMTLSSFHRDQQQSNVRLNENLKIQAEAWVNQFFSLIETLNSGANVHQLPYVTHRGRVSIQLGVPHEIEALDLIQSGSNQSIDPGLEENLLNSLKRQVLLNDLKIAHFAVGTVDAPSTASGSTTSERIFFVIPELAVNANRLEGDSNVNTTATNTIDKIQVFLIDPVTAFAGLNKPSLAGQRVFLMGRSGKILAHTSPTYVGTDLKKSDLLRESIENLFLGAQTGYVGHYRSTDGSKNQIAFVRVGTLPFAFGAEQVMPATVLTTQWFKEQMQTGPGRNQFGLILFWFAIGLMLTAVMSITLSRRIKREWSLMKEANLMQEANAMQDVIASPIRQVISETPAQESVDHSVDQFIETRLQLDKEVKQKELHAEAITESVSISAGLKQSLPEKLIQKMKTAFKSESIERDLVDLCSQLTGKPVLFFRYHPRKQILSIAAAAGSVTIQNHTVLQVYVRKDIENQIEQFANKGKLASLSNYGPMSKMIKNHLNQNFFDAWSVTCDSTVNSILGARLMGVVVVLHTAEAEASLSPEFRPQLAKMIREAGNYLFALQNKIRPTQNAQSIQNPSL